MVNKMHQDDQLPPWVYVLTFVLVAMWLTHILGFFMGKEGFWMTLIGAIFFPAGMIHGALIWFGVF